MIFEHEVEFTFKHSWNFRDCHHTVYRNDSLGIQCETITPKTCNGYGVGKSKSFYFIDHDEREFFSLTELVEAYNEKFKFEEDNPEHEVKFVKIIIKRKNKTE